MIGLLDCNNFFVSCERLFRPDLEGVPVAVLSGNDGCVIARSQEVKDLGIAMGVPLFQVKDICKKGKVVLFSGNPTLYRDISARVMTVLSQEVGNCDVYSIDEAFFSLPEDITRQEVCTIRNVVMKNVGIPVSIGVAHTKTLAKQASTFGKKGNGVCMLSQKEWGAQASFVKCGEIWGLGKQTSTKLSQRGVPTALDFMNLPRNTVRTLCGITGERIYDELHGTSVITLKTKGEDCRKSIASTRSFKSTTTELSVLESAVAGHITHCAEKIRQKNMVVSKILVQLQTDRFGDFFMKGGSSEVVLENPTSQTSAILNAVLFEMRSIYTEGVPYKKTGVAFSGLMPEEYVMTSLFQQEVPKNEKTLDEVMDTLNNKFGRGTVQSAVIDIMELHNRTKNIRRSPSYTTQWKDIPSILA